MRMEPENTHEMPTDKATDEQPAMTPTKKPSITLPAAILSGAVIIALAIVFAFHSKGGAPTAPATAPTAAAPQGATTVPADVATLRSSDYIRGNKNADVLLIEYSDSDCPFCQKFHPTLQQIVSDYNGKVAWVYRFFPLASLHPNAYTEALALSCVGELGGNDTFWTYLDTLINVTLNPDPTSNEALTTFATKDGVDANLFKTCFASKDTSKAIDASIAEAQAIGARGTPFTIAVNQKTGKQAIIPGAYPIEYVKQQIDSLMK